MSILTKDELREHVETSLTDAALDRIIAANEAALNEWAGTFTPAVVSPAAPIADVTETVFRPATSILPLHQVPDPDHITSVTVFYSLADPGRALTETEYYVRPDGLSLAPFSGYYWPWRTVVVYRPLDSLAVRKMALIELCALDINRNPGLASQTIGDWSESYQADGSYDVERSAILLRVYQPRPFA